MDKKLHALPENKTQQQTHPTLNRISRQAINFNTSTSSDRYPLQRGDRYPITMIDRQMKWPEAIPTDNITARNVAHTVYQHWIARYECPTIITTDKGRQFDTQIFSNLMKLMGIKKIALLHTTRKVTV
ncbi:hypothetical protein EVAR_35546_1 [Eumeta japonica]|uniref:Integrase catalytic domain-containing protein n=1 Tax=Eumeta variegata TaxID=151549 RepID=A0A4C1X957_EUMVA|nr:hypothetical protein EVAR_35546_1 [Eumeta japonica]